MARPFADDIQLTLKGVAFQPVRGGDNQLLDLRFGEPSRGPDVGAVRVLWDISPADEPLALIGHSLGGRVSTLYTGRHPEKIAGLVVGASTSGGLDRIVPGAEHTPRSGGSTALAERDDLNVIFVLIDTLRADKKLFTFRIVAQLASPRPDQEDAS